MKFPLNISADKPRHVVVLKQNDPENLEEPKLSFESVYVDPPLKCYICKEMQADQEEFDKHLTFHDSPPYRCEYCNIVSRTVQLWNSHMKMHNEERPFGCKECNLYYKLSASRRNHIWRRHTKHVYKKQTFVCCHCAKTFDSRKRLAIHEALHNGQIREKTVPCMYCDKKFVDNAQKDYHELTHKQVKSYKCDLCGRAYARKERITMHMEKHIKDKTIQCEYCDSKFASSVAKNRHVRGLHMPKRKGNLTSDSNGTVVARPLYLIGTQIPSGRKSNMVCPICNEVFRTNRLLIDHIDLAHPHNNLTFYTCSEENCVDKFISDEALLKHKNSKHSTFKCRFCPQQFLTKGKRLTHQNGHKDKVICPKEGCGKMFTSTDYLANHLKFTHSDIKNYKCSYCDKKFKKSCERKLHERSHTGE